MFRKTFRLTSNLKKTFTHIEDLLTDEDFRSWVLHPTPELDAYWEQWLLENPERKVLVEKAKLTIASMRFEQFKPSSQVKERIFDRISSNVSVKHHRKNQVIGFSIKLAAAIILTVAVLSYLYINLNNPISNSFRDSEITLVQKQNVDGVKSQHLLSDGSIIILNSGSYLEYPKKFTDSERVVYLKGEAYFDIKTDSLRPFRVEMDEFSVEVLGTQFNVNTLEYSPSVALLEGAVKVISDGPSVELAPGQKVVLDKEQNSYTLSDFDVQSEIGWKDGYLVFEDSSLDEVIKKLNRWYGVEIVVNNYAQSATWSYTASFKDENLENVMQVMSSLRRFEYQIMNDSLIISF